MMKVFDWLVATSPSARGITKIESQRRAAMRSRVFAAAGTTHATLAVAKRRAAIGRKLIERLEVATLADAECAEARQVILWADEIREID